MRRKPVEVFCDGSLIYKTKKGGFSAVLLFGEKIRKYSSPSYVDTTIARMEMKAIIYALEKVKPGFDIYVYSDNKIVIDTINKWLYRWVEKNTLCKKSNYDLWGRFIEARKVQEEKGSTMAFCWIRSHTGHKYNEMADHLAKKAARKKSNIKCLTNN